MKKLTNIVLSALTMLTVHVGYDQYKLQHKDWELHDKDEVEIVADNIQKISKHFIHVYTPAEQYQQIRDNEYNDTHHYSGTIERKLYLDNRLDEYINCWYGTPWAFEGTTKKPGEGEISCAYFVSTVLSHLGYRNNIREIGMMPSKEIVEYFAIDETEKKFDNSELLLDYIKESGEGFYLLGLDTHVGFVRYKGGKIDFIHSTSRMQKKGVVCEDLMQTYSVAASEVFYVGKLFSKWDVKAYFEWGEIDGKQMEDYYLMNNMVASFHD